MSKLKISAIIVCIVTALVSVALLVKHLVSDEHDSCEDDNVDCDCSR